MDFSPQKYTELLRSLKKQSFSFQTFQNQLQYPEKKVMILRHDVDLLPQNSLEIAKIENKFGIKGSYYFRAVPESWDEKIISEISSLGHEIGYHYENLTTCKGNYELAIKDFEINLEKLRKLASVKTICMHGSPLSKWDSKELWTKYNYKNFGIIGEPYFDINFNDVFYLTDTGRRWDGYKVSVRDKITEKQKEWEKQGLSFHSTNDIIKACSQNKLPNKIMFTIHPQRWNSSYFYWTKELIFQNIKNIIKRFLFVKKHE